MSCTNMNYFEEQVAAMTEAQKETAAAAGFSRMDSMPNPERRDIILGMCAASNLYSLNISEMPQIDKIPDLSSFLSEASSLDKSEKFEAGLKSFFTINYSPTSARNEMFLGVYASASIAHVDIVIIQEGPVDDIVVGPIASVW